MSVNISDFDVFFYTLKSMLKISVIIQNFANFAIKNLIMLPKKYFLLLLITFQCFCQQNGFWDKQRAFTKQVTLKAGKRMIVQVEDLPEGSTEVVYRITLLDENQQMANSLVSLLKAIPDPTGISQGSAGAVFLLSKITGDDKCKYAIFTNATLATQYLEDGIIEKACLFQETPINKDARRLSLNSSCLKSNAMWFGFQSKNWVMNERIVIEVVPWVDYKLSRGWDLESRKELLFISKSTDLAKKIYNSDEFCGCVLEKIQNQYTYKEYKALLSVEKTKIFKDAGTKCFIESGAANTIYDKQRVEGNILFNQKKYGEANTKLLPVIASGTGTVADYNAIATNYIFSKQYDKALQYLKAGEKLDDIELLTKLNLAHTYLLKNKFSQAKTIYKKYHSQNVSDSLSWKEKVKLDFDAFQKAGLNTNNFDRILRIIN